MPDCPGRFLLQSLRRSDSSEIPQGMRPPDIAGFPESIPVALRRTRSAIPAPCHTAALLPEWFHRQRMHRRSGQRWRICRRIQLHFLRQGTGQAAAPCPAAVRCAVPPGRDTAPGRHSLLDKAAASTVQRLRGSLPQRGTAADSDLPVHGSCHMQTTCYSWAIRSFTSPQKASRVSAQ